MSKKAETAYRTISEVASSLNLPAHVLRFWESKFSQIDPLKRGGGRRYYRPEDVEIIERIQDLLHNQGYTIKGVQQLLANEAKNGGKGSKATLTVVPSSPESTETAGKDTPAVTAAQLFAITKQLTAAKEALQKARQQNS